MCAVASSTSRAHPRKEHRKTAAELAKNEVYVRMWAYLDLPWVR
jgi:hypothetical protein